MRIGLKLVGANGYRFVINQLSECGSHSHTVGHIQTHSGK